MPLQSSVAGAPGVQLSWTCPATQEVDPVRADAPTPPLVACPTYPSSAAPLQFSSIPLQLVSDAPGWTFRFASLQSPLLATYPGGGVAFAHTLTGVPDVSP